MIAAAIVTVGLLLTPGCGHQPQYPGIGAVQVSSDPAGCEILLDGSEVRRQTPCRLDGLNVGAHLLQLRKSNFHVLSAAIEVRPGQTKRLHYDLQVLRVRLIERAGLPTTGIDLDYEPETGTLFVAGEGGICVFRLSGDHLTGIASYGNGGRYTRIAGSARANRVFTVRSDDGGATELLALDAQTGTIVRACSFPGLAAVERLRFSPDRNLLVAADSAGRRLVVIDARLCTVLRYVALPGAPSDVLFDGTGREAYVTMADIRRLSKIDLLTGTERGSAATGASPGGLFWSRDSAQIGFCNVSDKTITLVRTADWASAATIGGPIGGTGFPFACATRDPLYLAFLAAGSDGGALCTIYLPSGETNSRIHTDPLKDGSPVRMFGSADGSHFFVLNQYTLWAAWGDF